MPLTKKYSQTYNNALITGATVTQCPDLAERWKSGLRTVDSCRR